MDDICVVCNCTILNNGVKYTGFGKEVLCFLCKDCATKILLKRGMDQQTINDILTLPDDLTITEI